MFKQLAALFGAVRAMGSIVGIIKSLMLPFAYLLGRWHAHKEQYKINERLRDAYDRIEEEDLTDEDVDRRLGDGKI